MRRVFWLVSLSTCLIAVSAVSFAQDEAEESEGSTAESGDETSADASDAEAAADAEAKPEAAAARSGAAPEWWVGPYIEGLIVPSFILNLFLDASPTVFTPSFGVTITRRNAEGFSWVLGIGYASYGFDGPFRAKGDPEQDTEYLDSGLGLLHVRGMLLWSTDLSRTLSFEYGVGVELGAVLGSMTRTEAYKDFGGNFHPCVMQGVPDLIFCEATTNGLPTNAADEKGAHYHVKETGVPPVAGALMLPALALRYTPIEKLAIKLEASFGLFQFTFGLSAAYAIGA